VLRAANRSVLRDGYEVQGFHKPWLVASAGEQFGLAVLEVQPEVGGRGESVEPVEVADGGDLVELFRVWLDPDPDLFAWLGGEGEVVGSQDAGLNAGGDLPAAAAWVGGVDEAAAVVDDLLEGAPRPRDALSERVPAAASTWAPSTSVSPATSASR
jgi:hypothetical protein